MLILNHLLKIYERSLLAKIKWPIRGELGETLTGNADGNTEPSAKPSLRRCRDYLRQNGLS